MLNSNLCRAKKEKNDEFYTQYKDVEAEVKHYNLKDMVVYCNCDNPAHSNFYKYFKDNFHTLQIKNLYATGYNKDDNGYYAEYDGKNETIKSLNGNGSFDSDECKQIMQECDIVITNPPFSLFRQFIAQIMEYEKKFIILGNMNAITYKEIFPYIKNDQMWWGVSLNGTKCNFVVPKNYEGNNVFVENGVRYGKVNNAIWFTNIPHIKQNKPLILTKKYNPIDYPHYENYDAINVNKVKDIPIDYDGVMGVPITFLNKYCPSQFEIVWITDRGGDNMLDNIKLPHTRYDAPVVNGKGMYKRILIKRKQ